MLSSNEIVLLHGLGGDASVWNPIRSRLKKLGYQVTALDILGMGKADRPDDVREYALEKVANRMWNNIEELGIKKPVLVGHCYGGIVAQKMISEGLEVSGLVLIASANRLPWLVRLMGLNKLIGWTYLMLAKVGSTKHLGVLPNYNDYIGSADISIRRWYWDIRHTSIKSYFAILADFVKIDGRFADLKKVNCDTLILAGESDRIYPVYNSIDLNNEIDNSELKIVEGVGHLLPIDVVEVIVRELDEFCCNKINRKNG